MKQKVNLIRNTKGGHAVEIISVHIGTKCLICGKKRGKPVSISMHRDDNVYTYHQWVNECGHVEDQKKLREEGKATQLLFERDRRLVNVEVLEGTRFTQKAEAICKVINGEHDRDQFSLDLQNLKDDGWKSCNYYKADGTIDIKMNLDIPGFPKLSMIGHASIIKYDPTNPPLHL